MPVRRIWLSGCFRDHQTRAPLTNSAATPMRLRLAPGRAIALTTADITRRRHADGPRNAPAGHPPHCRPPPRPGHPRDSGDSDQKHAAPYPRAGPGSASVCVSTGPARGTAGHEDHLRTGPPEFSITERRNGPGPATTQTAVTSVARGPLSPWVTLYVTFWFSPASGNHGPGSPRSGRTRPGRHRRE